MLCVIGALPAFITLALQEVAVTAYTLSSSAYSWPAVPPLLTISPTITTGALVKPPSNVMVASPDNVCGCKPVTLKEASLVKYLRLAALAALYKTPLFPFTVRSPLRLASPSPFTDKRSPPSTRTINFHCRCCCKFLS